MQPRWIVASSLVRLTCAAPATVVRSGREGPSCSATHAGRPGRVGSCPGVARACLRRLSLSSLMIHAATGSGHAASCPSMGASVSSGLGRRSSGPAVSPDTGQHPGCQALPSAWRLVRAACGMGTSLHAIGRGCPWPVFFPDTLSAVLPRLRIGSHGCHWLFPIPVLPAASCPPALRRRCWSARRPPATARPRLWLLWHGACPVPGWTCASSRPGRISWIPPGMNWPVATPSTTWICG